MAAFDWVKLELLLPNDAHAERASIADGIVLTTLDALGDTPANRRRLYELNAACSADIPGRGAFHTWEIYQELRLDVPSFNPAGVTLALDGEDWVGMSVLSDHRAKGYCFAEMTGVVASHRRRGIASAMKVHGLGFAEACGVGRICTVHHPDNTAMIDVNRRLGYVDAHWQYPPTS